MQQLGQGATEASGNLFNIAQFHGKIAVDDQINNLMVASANIRRGDPSKTVIGPDGKPQPDMGFMGLQGADALNKPSEAMSQLDDAIQAGRNNLKSPQQQLEYDVQSRRMRNIWAEEIGQHADTQFKTWAQGVNTSKAQLSLNEIIANPTDPKFQDHVKALIDARVQAAQIKFGDDPEIKLEAIADARREAFSAQLESISVNDPARALTISDQFKQTAGTDYESLANKFRARAEAQVGQQAGADAIAKAHVNAGQVLPASVGAATPDQLHHAIVMQESRGNLNAPTSVGNAIGPGQIQQATFQQYAKPGEDIHNPADNLAVSQRIINDYYQRFGGDPQRVAVAYFSGPGNVAPQNSPTPWIHDRSDGNGKSTSSYVSDVSQRLGGGPVGPGHTKADAYKTVMDDPKLPQAAKQHAIQYINQTYSAAQVAAEQDAKAKKDANDHAADGYVTRMLTGNYKDIVNEIANDPNLSWETKRLLGDAAEKQGGSDVAQASQSYGSGFWPAYKAITAPVGDPTRLADPTELLRRAGPDGDLTLAGVQKLSTVMREGQRSVSDQAVNTTKVGLINYAKNKLSFDQEMLVPGVPPIRDPKGEAIFNAQFIPKFEAAYDKWTKDGKDPWQFLTQENVDKLMTGMRSKSEMSMDRIAATGESTQAAAPAAPTPLPPNGVDQQAWSKVVLAPPATEAGPQFSRAAWARAVGILAKNPTPENIKAFDNSQFGRAGAKASEVLGQLGGKPAVTP